MGHASASSKTRLLPEPQQVLSCESPAVFLHFPLEEKGPWGFFYHLRWVLAKGRHLLQILLKALSRGVCIEWALWCKVKDRSFIDKKTRADISSTLVLISLKALNHCFVSSEVVTVTLTSFNYENRMHIYSVGTQTKITVLSFLFNTVHKAWLTMYEFVNRSMWKCPLSILTSKPHLKLLSPSFICLSKASVIKT